MKILNSLMGYIIYQLLTLGFISLFYIFCGNEPSLKKSCFFLGSYLLFSVIYYNLACIDFEISDQALKFDKNLFKKNQTISFTAIDSVKFVEINFFIAEIKYVKIFFKNKMTRKFYCNSVLSENQDDSDPTLSFYTAYEYTKSKFEATFFVERNWYYMD